MSSHSRQEADLEAVAGERGAADRPEGEESELRGERIKDRLAALRRLDREPRAMRLRRRTVEHVFGTIKAWMGATHFKTRRLKNVASEMSLQVLAYNLRRVVAILGVRPLIAAIQA